MSVALAYALSFAGILDAAHVTQAVASPLDPAFAAFCADAHAPAEDGAAGHKAGGVSCCLPAVPLGGVAPVAADYTTLQRIPIARKHGALPDDATLGGFPPSAQGTPRAPPLMG